MSGTVREIAADLQTGDRTQESQDSKVCSHNRRIAVIGLGYVGLPVAISFARPGFPVIGFDISRERIAELEAHHDRTRELDPDTLRNAAVRYTDDLEVLREADFFIVTVPTPLGEARRPDLGALLKACETVGHAMRPGAIVVFESTVYPGATQEDCVPVLERASSLICGRDFTVGYSPERINPGDPVHRFETIRKIVSGQDQRTLDIVANVYESVVKAGVYRASSIKVAEAAKVIENSQRDLNIAFMNELSAIFQLLGIDTNDVLAAAGTKWNFLPFSPGLVGGHCIGVDPYYLTHCAERKGYHPEVILAGRRINDAVGARIAHECVRLLLKNDGRAGSTVTVLGLTFKENVPDIRNSKVVDIITSLRSFGLTVQVADPLAIPEEVRHEYDFEVLPLDKIAPADAVIFAVAHDAYVIGGWKLARRCLKPNARVVLDVKGLLDLAQKPEGIEYWRL
jgi:UDP-N-acetyl-D-glucosamine/UDP-N-acetyl-D-galactosamine dehydrogenase